MPPVPMSLANNFTLSPKSRRVDAYDYDFHKSVPNLWRKRTLNRVRGRVVNIYKTRAKLFITGHTQDFRRQGS